ncbi:Fic family protein [Singulisphaera sp. Ch08]|uniref:Fic family protein n=1 Tax=Singulisphaera sp. Ch08 TaxID=3120278 RepID=A0AAU7CMJ1_9BACT
MGEPLYSNESEKIQKEATNGLLLFDEVKRLFATPTHSQIISRSEIERPHEVAIKDIYSCAGSCRQWSVTIQGAKHKPPRFLYVEGFLDQMCEESSTHEEWGAIKVSAYVLWRLNWIHPFAGGNGRTARAASYLVLCRCLNFIPPGKLTIPEQIVSNRARYQDALEEADASWENQVLDVSSLEILLEEFLTKQLGG